MMPLKRFLDDQLDLVDLEGFRNIIIGAKLHGFDGRFRGREGSDHDHDRFRRYVLDLLEHCDAVDIRHLHVAYHQVEYLRLHPRNCVLPALGNRDVIACFLQHDGQEIPHALFIINNKYFIHYCLRFSETRPRPRRVNPSLSLRGV